MELENLIASLSLEEQEELYTVLSESLGYSSSVIRIDSEIDKDNPLVCPHCQSERVYGHGKYKGRNRYRCQSCKKTFNDYTGTAVSGIHDIEKFEKFIQMSIDSPSIRKVAKELNINIKTSFDWRHKLLSAFSKANGKKFSGIVECDDKQCDINEKGRRNLKRKAYKRPSDRKKKRGVSNDKVSIVVATDRENNPTMKFAKIGRIDQDSVKATIGDYVDLENILCSDSHPSIKAWANSIGIKHHTFVASKQHVKNKCYHVQHVNAIDNLYERWLKRFYGVATKYLSQYLNWFVLIRKLKNALNPVKEIVKSILKDKNSANLFRNIEENYLKLNIPQYYQT